MGSQQLVFVFGCQRSGTTATINGLKQLHDCHVFDEENSQTNVGRENIDCGMALRLKPLDELSNILAALPNSVVILKPLVESQRARQILEHFAGAVGLWMFRDYRDVIQSMLNKWGPQVGFNLLKSIREQRVGDWRSQHASAQTREMAGRLLQLDLSAADAAALFWYARNQLFFEQGLDQYSRIGLVPYAKVVNTPGYLQNRLEQLGVKLAIDDAFYNGQSLGKGSQIKLHPEIEPICSGMLARLEASAESSQLQTR